MLRTVTRHVVKFLKTEDGPTAVEYAVMLALIIVVCIGAITTPRPGGQRHVYQRRPERHAGRVLNPAQLDPPPMRHLKKALFRFLTAEDGPTAVEYAVMLALIIVVCVGAITTIGTKTSSSYTYDRQQVPGRQLI